MRNPTITEQRQDPESILQETLKFQDWLQSPDPKAYETNPDLKEPDQALAFSLGMLKASQNGSGWESKAAQTLNSFNLQAQPANYILQPALALALQKLHGKLESKPSKKLNVQSKSVTRGMLTHWKDRKFVLCTEEFLKSSPRKGAEAEKTLFLLKSLGFSAEISKSDLPTYCVSTPKNTEHGYLILRNSSTPGSSQKFGLQRVLYTPKFFARNLQQQGSVTLFLPDTQDPNWHLPAAIHGENGLDLGMRISNALDGNERPSSAKSKYIHHQENLWQEIWNLECEDIRPEIQDIPEASKDAKKAEQESDDLQEKESQSVYQNWKPTLELTCIEDSKWQPRQHPAVLSVPTALANLHPPTPNPTAIPKWLLQNQVLSDSQLEAYMRVQNILNREIPKGQITRDGFLLGDGTGTGKGRIIATLAAEAWSRGHRRSLWVSTTPRLANDALRDWKAVGGTKQTFHRLKGDSRQGIHLEDGLLFCSYASLRSNTENILEWLQQADCENDDPFLAFDECQSLGNVNSRQGAAAMFLQTRLPNARVLYTSSTPFRSTESLCYATRLGLWETDDAPFKHPEEMMVNLDLAGIAGLEILQQELCQMGRAMSRSLSVADIETKALELPISDWTRKNHNVWAFAWQIVSSSMEDAIKETNAQAAGSVPRNSMNAVRLAFFSHLVCSAKSEGMIEELEKDIAQGLAPVIQISSTMEAYASRRIAEWKEQEGYTPGEILEIPEDLDLSPKKDICKAVESHFPIHMMVSAPDPDDPKKTIAVPAEDSNGNKIESPKAIIARDAAVKALSKHPVAMPLLDRLCDHFGDRIAEVTGRSQRVERIDGKRIVVSRSPEQSMAEVQDFLNGRRDLLIFTSAGAHGRSYHSDRSFQNQKRRTHYLAQTSWAIDDVVQGLGRTHRTNQVSAPILKVVTTNIPGEARFFSTTCRKLAHLGALTRGDRRAQSNDSMSLSEHSNLDTIPGRRAIRELLNKTTTEKTWKGFDATRMRKLFGSLPRDTMGINVFLNNLITFPFQEQTDLMANYSDLHEKIYNLMASKDQLDNGVEILKNNRAESMQVLTLSKDPRTGQPDSWIRLLDFACYQGFGKPENDFIRFSSNLIEGVSGNRGNARRDKSSVSRVWTDPLASAAMILEIRNTDFLLMLYPGGAQTYKKPKGIDPQGKFPQEFLDLVSEDYPLLQKKGWNCHQKGSTPSALVNHVIHSLQKTWNLGTPTQLLSVRRGKPQKQCLGLVSGKLLPIWRQVNEIAHRENSQSLNLRIRKILVSEFRKVKTPKQGNIQGEFSDSGAWQGGGKTHRFWETGFVLPLTDALDLWEMMRKI